jgi:hypothetical protein
MGIKKRLEKEKEPEHKDGCFNCKYFSRLKSEDYSDLGWCRRYPPSLEPGISSKGMLEADALRFDILYDMSAFPMAYYLDWCGEWSLNGKDWSWKGKVVEFTTDADQLFNGKDK